MSKSNFLLLFKTLHKHEQTPTQNQVLFKPRPMVFSAKTSKRIPTALPPTPMHPNIHLVVELFANDGTVVWCVKYDTQIDTKMLASDWLLFIAANQKPAFW